MTTYRKIFTVQTPQGIVEMFYDAEEKEYTAQMGGFAGTARTQEKAIALMLACRADTLRDDDDDEN